MAEFAVNVVEIRGVEPIAEADRIELAVIGDYRSVVPKGQYAEGQMVAYIPEAAIVPDNIIEELGLTGKLAGTKKNRVKAVKFKGVLSQGLVYAKIPENTVIGDDLAEYFGIVKYEPPVPLSMTGQLSNIYGCSLKYDIENFKRYPDILIDGEDVTMEEKIHGTFCGVGVIPGKSFKDGFNGDGIVYSKGLGEKGLGFKDVPENDSNVYVRTARLLSLHDRLREAFPGQVVHVLGEVYGNKIQDLSYGRKDVGFSVFDIFVEDRFLDYDEKIEAAARLGLDVVPFLYRGPFSKAVMLEHTNGMTVLGDGANIREGVVIKPVRERRCNEIGRVILKSVSEAYLLRRDATEYS